MSKRFGLTTFEASPIMKTSEALSRTESIGLLKNLEASIIIVKGFSNVWRNKRLATTRTAFRFLWSAGIGSVSCAVFRKTLSNVEALVWRLQTVDGEQG